MAIRVQLRDPESPLLLRVSALAILALGVVGLATGAMPSYEAGRFYLIAAGLYLIAPSEALPKDRRKPRILLKERRYKLGVASISLAVVVILLQFAAQAI